jgi:hypothetical protein
MTWTHAAVWFFLALVVICGVACLPKKDKPLPKPFSDPRKAIHNNFTRDFH